MTNMGEDSALITIASPGNTGRPRNEVTLEQIHGQRETLGLVRQRLKVLLIAKWHTQFLMPTTESPS